MCPPATTMARAGSRLPMAMRRSISGATGARCPRLARIFRSLFRVAAARTFIGSATTQRQSNSKRRSYHLFDDTSRMKIRFTLGLIPFSNWLSAQESRLKKVQALFFDHFGARNPRPGDIGGTYG